MLINDYELEVEVLIGQKHSVISSECCGRMVGEGGSRNINVCCGPLIFLSTYFIGAIVSPHTVFLLYVSITDFLISGKQCPYVSLPYHF